ncbi:type II secretion system F family protein [Youngiibacter multivorans]|uniref:Type IV pilus assembly protein PilC n=1 Tax=Youngiibacter multivorans TaxID=937251 RepID=A0ABS4G7L5_9CLOT|nr:type II secretion system F family protein [Youngiibacter multivorans]MBP1920568.1 type IV pilus assembly protein PilC [Youngiibacter multivorans]
MPSYRYKGWNEKRNMVKGVLSAPDTASAFDNLRALSITPVSLDEKKEKKLITRRKLIREQDAADFCGHMAMMLQSGVNVVLSLEILEEQAKDPKKKKVFTALLEQVKRGEAISASMEETGEFPDLLVDMVRIGESTGDLDGIFSNMEEFYQKDVAVRSKVRAASVYPKILIFATFATLLFFMYFIVPAFKDLFESMENLPLPTRILLNLAGLFENHWPVMLIGISAAVIALILTRDSLKVRDIRDSLSLRVPLMGEFRRQVIISRVTRSLGVFLKSGIPLFTALNATKDIIRNRYVEAGFEKAIVRIMSGTSMSEAFEAEDLFEPMVYSLMRVGQETGRLDEMLYKVAAAYDRKVEQSLARLTARIEPLLILIIGGIVGFIIIAIAVPILTISQNIG